MSIVAIVKITALQGQWSRALEVIEDSRALCLGLEECSEFLVFQSQSDKHKFSFVERWSSIEKHKVFLEKLMNNKEFEAKMVVFTSAPDIEYFDER